MVCCDVVAAMRLFYGEKALLSCRAILYYLYIIQRFCEKVNNMRQSGESTGCWRGARAGKAGIPCGQGVYRSEAFGFAPALVSTTPLDDGAKYRSVRFAGGRGRPSLPRFNKRYIRRFYNVISTEAIAERRNPLRLSSDLVSATTVFNVHSSGFDKKFAKRQKIRAIFLISARL